MDEFSLIQKYFVPLTQARAEALGLKDDAAVLKVPAGREMAVTSDTLSAGVHFLENEKPEYIAHRALRVNLSDLAAMGAEPYAYQMCLAFPAKPREAWMRPFCAALAKDQKEFGIFCCGGDTTVIKGPLTVTITAFGLVPKGRAVMRGGAKPGDALVITGSVGDAFAGLRILRGKSGAYQKPVPRVAVAGIIRRYAGAAADISDGLIADVGHICAASGCAAEIDLAQVEFSRAVEKFISTGAMTIVDALTGGDDYELALAVPGKNLDELLGALRRNGLKPQVIGEFAKGKGVRVFSEGREVKIRKAGWRHF